MKKLSLALITFISLGAFAETKPYVENKTQAFLNKLAEKKGKPFEQLSINDARNVLVDAQKGAKLPKADVSDKIITVDGQSIKLTIIRPFGVKKILPGFMFFHGGGWVLGDFQTHERFVRDLVVDSGFAAVFVNYSPSPEKQYPTAINEAYSATKWVSENGKEIRVDGTKLAVVGNSVGGNMAAAVSLMAKEKGSPKLSAQILFWPVTDANFDNTSYSQFESGYFLTKNMMKWFWDNYTKDPKQRKEIYASPLNATLDQLKGLPPTLVQTAEIDVLRDEGESYARKLDSAGVTVVSVRYLGMIHDFGLLNILSDLPATREALHQASETLKKYLK